MLTVASASPADRPEACRVLFAHTAFGEAAAGRFASLIVETEFDPAGLIVAKDGDAVRGAMFAYRIGGGQAAVWPPVGADDVQDALVAGVLAWVGREPTNVIQAVVRSPELPRTPALVRAGFRHVTRLAYLAREPAAPPAGPTDLAFHPVTAPTPAFAALLLQTYDGTRDVPELNGHRTGDDVLAGYLASCGDRPPLWWRIESAGEPVGLLLLSPTDDERTLELTYLGLVPSARGRGLGRAVLGFALAQTMGRRLSLNVDVRNEPALRLYTAANFREFDRREVFLLFPTAASL